MTSSKNRLLSAAVIILFQTLTTPLVVVGAVDGDITSIPSTEWSNFETSLSDAASLHGPLQDFSYVASCEILGTNAYLISDSANGLCMQAHDCAREFCSSDEEFDLPSYVVEVKTEMDVAMAIDFASKFEIEVSIKTTGHSYQGSSTKAGTLMIWMHNFLKDGTINDNYIDTCGTNHGPVIGIAGGEIWDDVLVAVKDKYHIVTGGARTVSAAGGWLQGGGLSFSSRKYGVGVDQVVNFRVVLADGTAVDANACTNEDLFWALRGGGGGSFGVVTHVQYKLHPVTTIVEAEFFYGGLEWASVNNKKACDEALDTWFSFWIEKSPYLDSRWSGFFNAAGAHLTFSGSMEDAKSTFLDDWNEWYRLLDKTDWVTNVFGALPPQSKVYNSWYNYKGGDNAVANPDATDTTGDAYKGAAAIAARLMPQSKVITDKDAVKNLLITMTYAGELGVINYFLGGEINNVSTLETAVHPALRKSIWNIISTTKSGAQRVREFVSNDVTGVCYNHHNGLEPDWENACWGSNYDKLLSLKNKYDPSNMFNCWHCVGYQGRESENEEGNKLEWQFDPKYLFTILFIPLGVVLWFAKRRCRNRNK